MTQCLGLSLLSSIVATLGVDSSSRDGGGGGGGGRAGSSDDKHTKELQGLQVMLVAVELRVGAPHSRTYELVPIQQK